MLFLNAEAFMLALVNVILSESFWCSFHSLLLPFNRWMEIARIALQSDGFQPRHVVFPPATHNIMGCNLNIYRVHLVRLYGAVNSPIRRRSDYIIGFVAPAIGPNKSKKLTRLVAPAHNIRGQSLNEKQNT